MPAVPAQQPTTDAHGDETHPAYAKIAVVAVQATPGASLFNSDIRHQTYMTVTISHARRNRSVGHDYIYTDREILKVAMSQAQWAAFVSSPNTDGVPCTLTRTPDGGVPSIPFAPRLQHSIDEVSQAATKALAAISAAAEAVEAKPTKANIRTLRNLIDNAPRNMAYTATTLTKHVEHVVTTARADIEDAVNHATTARGVSAADAIAALTAPQEDQVTSQTEPAIPDPAATWNTAHPIGTVVDAAPGLLPAEGGAVIRTRTRSRAWLLGDGTPVVAVKGYPGGIHLDHITPIPIRPRYAKVEGEVYCLDHTTVHPDTTDPYGYGHPDCRRAEHRPIHWRLRKGDIEEAR